MASLMNGLRRMRAGMAPALDAQEAEQLSAELERSLLLADTGTKCARAIVERVRERAGPSPDLPALGGAVRAVVGELLAKLEAPAPAPQGKPHVVLLLGVNGSGKTTTAAKLARQAAGDGKKVVLAAADTFRAAAGEQLERLAASLQGDVRVIAGDRDPGAVAYNAVAAAQAAGADLVLVDTAGRQPSSKALMAEASKIAKAIGKAMPGAPHERILVLDANTGQNALLQLGAFDDTIGLTGCVVTKLDGTARGGVVLALAEGHDVPLLFVGVGEGTDDLHPYDSGQFLQALFEQDAESS